MRGSIQGIYRGLVNKAWRVHCERDQVDINDKQARDRWYRRELLRSPLNVYTSKQIVTADDEDAICLHFAMLTGDERQIHYWSSAEERRAMWVLRKTMNKLGVSQNYVTSVGMQMGFLSEQGHRSIDELPAELILKINAALDMHAHRRARKEDHELVS